MLTASKKKWKRIIYILSILKKLPYPQMMALHNWNTPLSAKYHHTMEGPTSDANRTVSASNGLLSLQTSHAAPRFISLPQTPHLIFNFFC